MIKQEIKTLLGMLLSSFLFGIVIILGIVYYLGSSGTYLLKDVLVSPSVLEKVSFEKESPFIYNKIEFVHQDKNGRKWGKYEVSVASYKEFYKWVSKKRSLTRVSNEMVEQFEKTNPSLLSILASIPKNKSTLRVFQEVQFLEGDSLFRVEKKGAEAEWIYFRYKGIYDQVLNLFAKDL